MAWLEQIISCNWLNAATSGQVINYLIDPLSNPEVQKRSFAVNYTFAGSFTDRLLNSSKNNVISLSYSVLSFTTTLQLIKIQHVYLCFIIE